MGEVLIVLFLGGGPFLIAYALFSAGNDLKKRRLELEAETEVLRKENEAMANFDWKAYEEQLIERQTRMLNATLLREFPQPTAPADQGSTGG